MECVKKERSVSPQCPKPDESGSPLGTATTEDTMPDSANDTTVKTENEPGVVITKEMEEEEKRAVEEGEREEEEMMAKARLAWEKDSQEMRFKRLEHLLNKSNIYSKFLLTKMEQQQQEMKLQKEKLQKKLEKGTAKTTDKVERKKRGREGDYQIADVMSKEEIMSKAKKAKVNEGVSSGKLLVEDLEKMKDSNDAIKERMTETMRENSKQILDPDRTVNGKPVPAQQPALLTGTVMRWYQIEGIEWLRMLWENGINGILADEMGLGKTIQCIAHIAMMVGKKVEGPFLIVAPLSTLPNWINEFKRFAPELVVQLYHGPAKERMKLLKTFSRRHGPLQMRPVVVTSFEIAMRDNNSLQRLRWTFLILDEGHRIKNMNCRLVRELKKLPTENKLLLTGTPLQNNLAELWSLLNFLLPEVFDDLKSFELWFDLDTLGADADNIEAVEREQKVLDMLHQILTPFLLRRLKSDVTLEVPPKKEILVYAPITKKQEEFYTALVNRTIAKMLGQEKEAAPVELTTSGRPKRKSRRKTDYFEAEAETPSGLDSYLDKLYKEQEEALSKETAVDAPVPLDAEVNLKLRNVLMLLKKACNHPYLIEYPLDHVTQEFKIDEQLVQTSGKFQILDRLLPELKKRGHKVLIFSTMTTILDLLMDYCYLRGYEYSRLDGSMPYALRDENMTKFASDPEVFLFLLSTRAGGLGINLTSADTVIIFDSDWNPQADLQAQDRCHRIGQTKPVLVYRLVTANTIDQKILERASAKRKLEKMVIHKSKFKGAAKVEQTKSFIDLDELTALLKSRDDENTISRAGEGTKGEVISDKDLEVLLDRSDLMGKREKRAEQEKVGVFRVVEANESSEMSLK